MKRFKKLKENYLERDEFLVFGDSSKYAFIDKEVEHWVFEFHPLDVFSHYYGHINITYEIKYVEKKDLKTLNNVGNFDLDKLTEENEDILRKDLKLK